MTENKFGWKVGDGLRWSSSEGCDHDCVVTKTMAQMIEFETEVGEVKRLKGNNPSISRIEDGPPLAEPTMAPESKSESGIDSETETKTDPEPETTPEPAAETDVKPEPDKEAECAPIDEPSFVPSESEERISERRAEVDLKSGGVVEVSVQVREGGSSLGAGEQEFRLNGEDEWHPSLEEALDAEYDRSWMCIRMRGG